MLKLFWTIFSLGAPEKSVSYPLKCVRQIPVQCDVLNINVSNNSVIYGACLEKYI